MPHTSASQTVNAFVDAMNRGDIDAAVAYYEPGGVLIAEPGASATGLDAIREALTQMLALRPSLRTTTHEVIATDDLALYHSDWQMAGTSPDGAPVVLSGKSADVLRKQADGGWKIAIDNPWGAEVLAA